MVGRRGATVGAGLSPNSVPGGSSRGTKGGQASDGPGDPGVVLRGNRTENRDAGGGRRGAGVQGREGLRGKDRRSYERAQRGACPGRRGEAVPGRVCGPCSWVRGHLAPEQRQVVRELGSVLRTQTSLCLFWKHGGSWGGRRDRHPVEKARRAVCKHTLRED